MGELINGRTAEEIKRWVDGRATCNTCPKEHEVGCEYGERTEDCQMTIDTIAYIEHLESERDAALAKVPKWISVEERLPEESGYYLYLCDSPIRGLQNGVGVSYFQHKAKLWKKVYNPCVTHWMPLPESKKEDA